MQVLFPWFPSIPIPSANSNFLGSRCMLYAVCCFCKGKGKGKGYTAISASEGKGKGFCPPLVDAVQGERSYAS